MKISKKLAKQLGITEVGIDRETLKRNNEKIQRKVDAITNTEKCKPTFKETGAKPLAAPLKKIGILHVLQLED